MQSVPGLGPITSLTVLADWPELGRLFHAPIAARWASPRSIATAARCAAGAACGRAAGCPHGTVQGDLRATRCVPAVQSFYARLLAAGKPKKGALVACRHKLLTILNAMLKHQTPGRLRPPEPARGQTLADTVALLSARANMKARLRLPFKGSIVLLVVLALLATGSDVAFALYRAHSAYPTGAPRTTPSTRPE